MKYLLNRLVFESKKTELETEKLLLNSNIESTDIILNDFKDIDNTKNQIMLPIIGYFYVNGVTNMKTLQQTFKKIPNLLDNNLIKTPTRTKKGIVVGNDTYTDFLNFSEYIDSVHGRSQYKKTMKDNKDISFEKEDEPIWTGNGIEIYAGSDVGTCVRLGRGHSFCISEPGNTMYQSYRDSKTSTFYFIYDSNQKDNPLKIVVFDNTKNGVELTDTDNKTGSIYEYGEESEGYIEYLKSKNVPVDELLLHKPKSEREIEEDRLLKDTNYSLEWFKNLSSEYKSKYIGRGHTLSDEQFNYLVETKLDDLLRQHVKTGLMLSNKRVDVVEKYSVNILKSYLNTIKNRQDTEHRVNLLDNEYINTAKKMFIYGYIKKDSEEYYEINDNTFNFLYNSFNNNEELKKLLDSGIDPDITDDINRPILVSAIHTNNIEAVTTLLDSGADPNIIDDDIPFATPLGWAEQYGYEDIINVLKSKGAK